ncbi:MAG: HlyD family secretion protein [Pyrinomonadaceae bacterium]
MGTARFDELGERADFVSADARGRPHARRSGGSTGARPNQGSRSALRRSASPRRASPRHIGKDIHSRAHQRRRFAAAAAGESYALETQDASRSAIFTIADTSVLRVRVDVDEADVGKLKVGQTAYVPADAYGDRRFAGRIVRIGQVLGKKNVRTNEPTERVDTKILETLIELDEGQQQLPPGLRVDAFIVTGASDAPQESASAGVTRQRGASR